MKRVLRRLTLSSVAMAALAHGQTPPPAPEERIEPVQLEPMKPEGLNRVSLSYRMGLNITADFKHLGGLVPLSNPGAATGGAVNRTYDNGYNLIDTTGNDHGPGFQNTTWNWGYKNANSVQNNQMVLSSSSSLDNASSKNNSDDPQHGFEIGYSRQLFQKGKWKFGLDSALGYTRISISDSRTLRGNVTTITDSFAVPSGVTVPPPGYTGTFDGPGAVIGSEPSSREIIASRSALIVGNRSLESDVFSLRLGPYAEVPLNDKFSLQFNVGLYLAAGASRFDFIEVVTLSDVGTEVHSGSRSQTDFLLGAYAGMNVEYALSKQMSLIVGAQFQSAGETVNQGAGRNLSLDQTGKSSLLKMDKSIIVSVGASYSF
jgi:hypothetical protein